MLTIHVGLHKTGSTALQNYLRHAPRTLRRSLVYLGEDNLLGHDGFRVPSGLGGGQTRSLSVDHRRRNVIVSSEAFLGRGWSMYSNARDHALEMREHFDKAGEYQVVIYLRPQYDWFESAYVQYVQEGNTETAGEFVGRLRNAKYCRYTSLVDDLVDILGPHRIVVRAYQSGVDVRSDFLEILGVKPYPYSPGRSASNVSIGPAQAEILRRINKRDLGRSNQRLARWFLQNGAMGNADGDVSVLPGTLQEQLIELTSWDWQALSIRVRETKNHASEDFQRIAKAAAEAPIRPCIAEISSRDAVLEEAIRILATALPMAAYRLQPPVSRWQTIAHGIRHKVTTDPLGMPSSAQRLIRHKVVTRRRPSNGSRTAH